MGELPPSDSEEEEEEEVKVVSHAVHDDPNAHAHIEDVHGDNENKIVRKGTGFVHMGELPPSDSEEEEEEVKVKGVSHAVHDDPNAHAHIEDLHGDNESKIVRK